MKKQFIALTMALAMVTVMATSAFAYEPPEGAIGGGGDNIDHELLLRDDITSNTSESNSNGDYVGQWYKGFSVGTVFSNFKAQGVATQGHSSVKTSKSTKASGWQDRDTWAKASLSSTVKGNETYWNYR